MTTRLCSTEVGAVLGFDFTGTLLVNHFTALLFVGVVDKKNMNFQHGCVTVKLSAWSSVERSEERSQRSLSLLQTSVHPKCGNTQRPIHTKPAVAQSHYSACYWPLSHHAA